MIVPRWRKVLSDVWGNKVRTLLVALSIAVGVFAVGVVSGSYSILKTDIPLVFSAANPHSAQIYASLFDEELVEIVRRTEGVAAAEGHTEYSGKIETIDGKTVPINFSSVPELLSSMEIDKVKLESGSETLGFKEIYLEGSSVAALGVQPGDTVSIVFGDRLTRQVRVAGIVHNVWANSYAIANNVTAYTTPETIEWFGGNRQFNLLVFTVSERGDDEAHVKEVSKRIEDKIKRGGREVYLTFVFRPGVHPAQQTIDAVLVLLGAMGMLALLLSTFLVVNTINGLLSQQIRQIGVMKAVGATSWQVSGMYLVLILLFGVIALLIAVPLAALVAFLLAGAITQLINLDLLGFRIPQDSLYLQLIVGLGVPLLAGAVPVINGSRMTVRAAMSNYGLSNSGKRGLFDYLLETVHGLPRPLAISIRNTFRKKGRLVLTLSTLMLGGAIFIAVINVKDSLYSALDTTFGYILSDVNVDFNRSYRMERIEGALAGIPGIVSIEGWGGGNGQVMKADETAEDVVILAPPAGSTLIDPVLTSGRWLTGEDENAVVVGNHYIKLHPETKVGDRITIRIEEKDYPFTIVGIYKMAGTVFQPILYMNFEYLASTMNESGQAYSIRVVTDAHDAARQKEVSKAIEARLKQLGYPISSIITGQEIVIQQRITVDVLIYLLLGMAILIAVVGGLGLMGTMGMNVLERTREIGVMRSIGAVDSAIMQLVLVEGMVIGLISWALGAVLSIPIAQGLNNVIGTSLLNVPLDYTFSLSGLIMWAVIVAILSTVACIIPARNAVRLTVRDVLAYE